MDIYISGSLAYDRIMNFEGRFSDHILPDKIHVLNVSFNVNGLQEKLGGTAGNIAYGLALLGEKPRVLGCLGRDGQRYLDWMAAQGIDASRVRVVAEEFTAGAFITTDISDNQITGFNPGAMSHACGFDPQEADAANSIAIIAPGNLSDLTDLPGRYRAAGVPFIFDPGQSLNILDGDMLVKSMEGALALTSNDYELEMICRKTGRDTQGILELVTNIITTKAEHGSVLLSARRQVEIPPAQAARVVDPTGAGDAYRSGLLKGLSLGQDLAEACLWGSALASFAVAEHGTQEYRVDQERFNERLSQIGGRWPQA
ncbi:MAG: carbohydrate kinase family protein [Deltaproteobacteria bacterium]|nr:carbohydrate kinase family protein [Deltaproteobacteria bacterium]